jgi:hypothetical protein
MDFMKMSGKIALIALAAVCLFAAPVLSMQMDRHGGMFPQMNNLTAEEMGNMTLGELKETQRQAWNNTTACHAKEPGQNYSQLGKMDEMKSGRKGAFPDQNDNGNRCDRAPQGMARASPVLLLMDDLTVEDLGNMTVNQIKALVEKKMQELDSMTLNQMRQLQEKKAQDRDNLTLNQLKEENKNMRQIAGILEWAGSESHIKA